MEALAASGLRSIRYALEVPSVEKVVANDYSRAAYQNMIRNIEHNKIGDKVSPSYNDARQVPYLLQIVLFNYTARLPCSNLN